tara:strand:+ start:49258 stop:50010 length:753 start_codon:yes stop_codon:yes gene_type:complete
MIKIFRNARKRLLNEGKTSSYLKYAIGEIVLVMIGILLALQINNWNEDSKKSTLRIKYLSSLVEDLKQDTAMIAGQHQFYKEDTLKLSSQIARIKKHKNIDTIKNIARHEFDITVQLITAFSNKTYQTLINTGNIDLIDPWLVEELSKLDQLQKLTVDIYKFSMESYSQTSTVYNQQLPFKDDALAGKLLDGLWENINKSDFLAKYNQMLTSKITIGGNVILILPPIYKQTESLLKKILLEYPELSSGNK